MTDDEIKERMSTGRIGFPVSIPACSGSGDFFAFGDLCQRRAATVKHARDCCAAGIGRFSPELDALVAFDPGAVRATTERLTNSIDDKNN